MPLESENYMLSKKKLTINEPTLAVLMYYNLDIKCMISENEISVTSHTPYWESLHPHAHTV